MKLFILVLMLVLTNACGKRTTYKNKPSNDLSGLQQQILMLQEQAEELEELISSDFASCPASGDTTDPLIRKMCQVAQAATVELRTEIVSELASYVSVMNSQISSINSDITLLQSQIDNNTSNVSALQLEILSIQSQLSDITSDLNDLQDRMDDAESAITALQNLTSSILGSINGFMVPISVGEENLSAGPFYETVLKRNDSTRFNAYVEAYGIVKAISNNNVNATNNSNIVTVSINSHGFVPGDVVSLSGLVGSRGFSSGHLNKEHTVLTALTNSFTIMLEVNASSSGSLGGATGSAKKVVGKGMSTIWKSGNVSDSSVRVTSVGSKRYNFIIRRLVSDITNSTAELCYDITNNLATFATINAAAQGGSGNIVCK